MNEEELRFAARAIREAESVVAMTGAGVSTASGIPDFRSEDGLWQDHDPSEFHISRFETDPGGFWADRVGLVDELFGADVKPNAAHRALADLEEAGELDVVVTQNVDGLHQAAGSEDVIELHGNGQRVMCMDCRRRLEAAPVRQRVHDGEVPPRCADCDGVLKPDVTLFGEPLPEYALLRAHSHAEKADFFLVIGSSLSVEPAASLPETAAGKGATLLIANLDDTPMSPQAEYDFRADVTDVMPQLREAVIEP